MQTIEEKDAELREMNTNLKKLQKALDAKGKELQHKESEYEEMEAIHTQ